MRDHPASRYRRSPRTRVLGGSAAAAVLAGLALCVVLTPDLRDIDAAQSDAITTFDVVPAPSPDPIEQIAPPPRDTTAARGSAPARAPKSQPASYSAADTIAAAPAPNAALAQALDPKRLAAAPPPPPPLARPTPAADPAIRTAYAERLWRRIAAGRLAGIHMPGTAKVTFRLSGSGALETAEITTSSGNPALDRLALRTIRHAAPFATPPQELGDKLTFTIAFRFD